MTPRTASILALLGLVFGVWSEWIGFGLDTPRSWIPDLLTGGVLLGAGALAWQRPPHRRVGLLLIMTAIAWFAGNLASDVARAPGLEPLLARGLADVLLTAHRGPLAHAILSYPDGSLTSRTSRGAVAIGYGSAVVGALWLFGPAPLIVASVVAAAAYHGYRRTRGHQRRSKQLAFRLALAVAASLAVGNLLMAGLGRLAAGEPATVLYELALAATGILLAAGLRTGLPEAAVADYMVELGDVRSGVLRDALAAALGDPSLGIGYRLGNGKYVDATGRSVDLPAPSAGRVVTRIERAGEEVAVLVHDPAMLDDAALVDAIAAAARLAGRHVELQTEVRDQVMELHASRRRLLDAGDAERQRLADRLGEGAMHRLDDLARNLGESIQGRDPALESSQRLARALDQVGRTEHELGELGQGLHPRDLREAGLVAALHELAEHSALPIDLALADIRLPKEMEAACYFFCAEGLANVAKHARAAHVSIVLRQDATSVTVEVIDDGVGGADVGSGSGLGGLTDRIEAFGGRLTLESPPRGGTRLSAVLPLGKDA